MSRHPRRPLAPECPLCGGEARRVGTRHGPRYECCGLAAWGSKPLTDDATRAARRRAHAAFDPLWRCGLASRGRLYQLLALELGVREPDAHMNYMDQATAERVPAAVRKIREDLSR